MKNKLLVLLLFIITMTIIITAITMDTDNNVFLYQKIVEECFANREGTMIVFNPQTGKIYGIVNEDFAKKGLICPFSTIKIVLAYAALDKNVISLETKIKSGDIHLIGNNDYQPLRNISGKIGDLLPGDYIKEWKPGGFGWINYKEAIMFSSNVFFSEVGLLLQKDNVLSYVEKFYGSSLNYHSEIPDKLTTLELINVCTHGDLIKVTPMGLASVIGAFANGGKIYDLALEGKKKDIADLANKTAISQISYAMKDSIHKGLWAMYGFPDMDIAGKSGSGGNGEGLFLSYGSTKFPEIAVVVFVENGYSKEAMQITYNFYKKLNLF